MDSELGKEELRYIIDVSRPESFKVVMDFFAQLYARLKNKDGSGFSYKPLNLKNGLDYTKEYPELALKLNVNIVFHPYDIDYCNSEKILILPKVHEHPS